MIVHRLMDGFGVLKKAVLFLGSFFAFVIILEVLKVYLLLSGLHPLAGVVFLAGLGGLVVWSCFRIINILRAHPRAPVPPDPARLAGCDSVTYQKAYLKYLRRVSRDLQQNGVLPESIRRRIQNCLENLPREDIRAGIYRLETSCLQPALQELDARAEAIVRHTVRDTMTGVILSPYRSLDAAVVVTRNVRMFLDLVRLYNRRPAVAQILGYALDVGRMVISVNVLSYTERITGNLMRNIPVLNRTTDDFIQGIGAGILTNATGRVAMARCRAYRGWDEGREYSSLLVSASEFAAQTRNILVEDILPGLGSWGKTIWTRLKTGFDRMVFRDRSMAVPVSSGSDL